MATKRADGWTMHTLLLVSSLALGGVLVGCSGGNDSDSDRIVRTGTVAAQTPGGRLTADPEPLTFDEVAKAGRTTPAGTVLALYFWAQWGSTPNVVAMYDPRVRSALGPITIADAYQDQRAALLSTRVVIKETATSRLGGAVVTVAGLTKNFPPTRDSFTLVRQDGNWYIVQDTVLERGLGAIAGFRATRGQTGPAARRRADTAAGAAARGYRVLALRLLRLTRRPARPPSRTP